MIRSAVDPAHGAAVQFHAPYGGPGRTDRSLGQDHVLRIVGNGVRAAKAGLKNPQQPMGCFLFVGPSGVGFKDSVIFMNDASATEDSVNPYPAIRSRGILTVEGDDSMLQISDQKVPLSSDPNGMLFVTGTRVSLHSVVGMFEEGASAEEIAHEYESLELADVYAVLTYYLRNKDAVCSKLASQESHSEEAARRYEQSFPRDLRAKLRQGK